MGRLHWLRLNPRLLAIWAPARRIRPRCPKAERRRRWFRAARRTIAAVLSGYLLILIFPELLFAHHLRHRNFHVYSEIPIDRGVIAVLDEAATLMARSSLDE